MLYDSAQDWKGVVGTGERAPYRANAQLMLPMQLLLCRMLVLATSHASVQWLLLEKFAGIAPLSAIMVVAVSCFGLHLLVLQQAKYTAQCGIFCDEALDAQRKRLRPNYRHATGCLAFFLLIMIIATSVTIAFGGSKALKACSGLLVAVLVHLWDFMVSCKGLEKWREPQLSSEFTGYPAEELPSSDKKPSTLTKKRETW